jgi:hypothetical protein
LLAGVVNAAGGAILIAGYGQTTLGVLNVVLGMSIAELQIWTRPTLATEAWRRYLRDYHGTKPSEVGPDAIEQFSMSLFAAPGLVGARGTF